MDNEFTLSHDDINYGALQGGRGMQIVVDGWEYLYHVRGTGFYSLIQIFGRTATNKGIVYTTKKKYALYLLSIDNNNVTTTLMQNHRHIIREII